MIKMFIKRVEQMPVAAKASIWFVIANIALKGISLITAPIFTRILEPSDYGITSVFASWENIIGIFATLSLAGGVYNNAMLDYESDINGYTSSMLALSTLSSALVYSICIITNFLYPDLFKIPTSYLVFMWVQTLLNATITFWLMRKRFSYNYKSVLRYSLGNALLSPVFALLAIFSFPGNKAYAKIIGAGFSTVIIGAIIFYQTFKRGKKTYVKKYWTYALKFSLPLIPHYLSYVVLGSCDKIMINNIIGEAEAGIYSVANSLAYTVNIIFSSINMSLIPYTLQTIKKGEYASLKKISSACIGLVAVICAGVTLFAPEIMAVLAPSSYSGAIVVVPPVICGLLASFVFSFFGNIEFYHKKTKYMSIASITVAIVNIVLNAIFIPLLGYIAAAYTTLFSYFVQLTMHFYFARKVEKNLNAMFNVKLTVLILLAYIVFTILCISIYDYLLYRMLLVCIIAICLVIFRKKIVNIYKEMKKGKKEA